MKTKWLLHYVQYAPYLVLAAYIMWPWLKPGFILTMDLVFTPHLALPSQVDNTYLFYAVLHMLNIGIPGDILEKLVLFLTFTLAGIGVHRLVCLLFRTDTHVLWAAYPAGLLAVLNPFVYSRLMMGQFAVVLGYALLPWFLLSLFGFLRHVDTRSLAVLSVWTIIISIISIHTLGYIVFIVPLTVAGFAISRRAQPDYLKRVVPRIGLWLGICCIASSYWLVPALLGRGTIAASLQTFGPSERQAYATVDTNGQGTLPAVMGLQGFWADTQNLYILPSATSSSWNLYQLLFWTALVVGFWYAWRHQQRWAMYFLALSVIATILALGVLSTWLVSFVPFFAGFRESQKFVAVLAVSDCYFFGCSILAIAAVLRKWGAWTVVFPAAAACVLAYLYTPTIFSSFYGQLIVRQYPADWYHMNALLDKQSTSGSILFLPWHLYMSFGFAGRIIATPAAKFFDRRVIASNDPELKGAGPQIIDPVRSTIEYTLLPEARKGTSIVKQLRSFGIRYILLAKELDWRTYDYLDRQPGIQRIKETATLKLYKIEVASP